MHCFHYSGDLFNAYCIHNISSPFFKYPKPREEFFTLLYLWTIATSVTRENGVLNSDEVLHRFCVQI